MRDLAPRYLLILVSLAWPLHALAESKASLLDRLRVTASQLLPGREVTPIESPAPAPSSPQTTSAPVSVPKGFIPLEQKRKLMSVAQRTNEELFAGLASGGWVRRATQDDLPLKPLCLWHHPQIDELVKRAKASPTMHIEIEKRFRELLEKRGSDSIHFHAAVGLLSLGVAIPLEPISQRALEVKAPIQERIASFYLLAERPAELDAAKLGSLLDGWFPEPDLTQPSSLDPESMMYADSGGLNPASLVREDPYLVSALLWAYVRATSHRQQLDASQNLRILRGANYGDEATRRVAAAAFAHGRWESIPEPLAKLLRDSNPMVRRAAICALAAAPTAAGGKQFLKSSFDQDPAVRVDAIDALGEVPGLETNRRLDELAVSEHPVDRRAVIRAARRLGLDYLLRSAANDSDWTVRKEAATALGDPKLGPVVETLRRLLHDRSPEVQVAAVDSLAALDPAVGVDGLLEALASSSRMTRARAALQLKRLWSAARSFDVDGTPTERDEALRQLLVAWKEEKSAVASTPSVKQAEEPRTAQAIDSLLRAWYQPGVTADEQGRLADELLSHGAKSLPAIETFFERHQSYPSADLMQRVLAELDPAYRELAALWQNPRQIHLAPVTRLEEALRERKLSRVQAISIVELLGKSHAPLVWLRLMPLVDRDFPDEARGRDIEGLQHPDPAVRAATCQRVTPYVTREHGPHLVTLFRDQDRAVRLAAIEAVGHIPGNEYVPVLRQTLIDRDAMVRLAAAAALHRQGDAAGAQELWRLGRDADPVIRRRVIEEVAALAQPKGTPAVSAPIDREGAARLFALGLADEKPAVKQEAIHGLETLLGQSFQRDQFGRPISMQEQVQRWNQLLGAGATRSPLVPLTMIED